MVHHALYYKQTYSYAGVIEMLSGAPFDWKFISFEDIKNDPHLLDALDVIINVGDADTAHLSLIHIFRIRLAEQKLHAGNAQHDILQGRGVQAKLGMLHQIGRAHV